MKWHRHVVRSSKSRKEILRSIHFQNTHKRILPRRQTRKWWKAWHMVEIPKLEREMEELRNATKEETENDNYSSTDREETEMEDH